MSKTNFGRSGKINNFRRPCPLQRSLILEDPVKIKIQKISPYTILFKNPVLSVFDSCSLDVLERVVSPK